MGVPPAEDRCQGRVARRIQPHARSPRMPSGQHLPEITEMQARAIIEAAMNVKATGIPVHVEIMVPLVGNHKGSPLPEEHHRLGPPSRSSPSETTRSTTWSAR